MSSPDPKNKKFNVTKTEAEWKKILSPLEYKVLRDHGTESAFSGDYHNKKEDGVYRCRACDYDLFDSKNKYDSGTGWPSFWQPIHPQAVGTSVDYKFFMKRTEVHCSNCGGHQGHVFNDGPQPTGLRYCMNSVSLKFYPRS